MAAPIVTTAIKQAQLPAPMCTGRPSISARRQDTTPISRALAATTTDTIRRAVATALVLTFSALVEQLGRPDGSTARRRDHTHYTGHLTHFTANTVHET